MRYLCPAPKFHDWKDDQPDVAGGLPALRFCPQHTKELDVPPQNYEIVGQLHDSYILKLKKEETKT